MRVAALVKLVVAGLAGVAALLIGPQASLAASWPAWARAAGEAARLERWGSADAVVVLDQWEIALKDGQRTGTRSWLVHVLTEDGRSHAHFSLARGPFDRFSKLKAWVRRPDGHVTSFSEDDGTLLSYSSRKTLDDTEILVIAPPGIAPGCSVAVQYGFTSAAGIPQDIFRIQSSIPVLKASVKVDARAGWKVLAKVAPGANPGPSEVTGEGAWEFMDIPARAGGKDEDAPEPPRTQLALDYIPPGSASPFRDWGATACWGADLFRIEPGGAPLFDASASRLASSGVDPIEEAGKIARRLRYFAVEIGWGGYRPRSPEMTLGRAFGDCKDKSHLMVALLRKTGVDAVPVLAIAPSDAFVDENLAGPRQFNHCIVGIPWESRKTLAGMTVVDAPGVGVLRLFDPTLSDASPQDLSVELEGGAGLVLDPRTSGLLRFPGSEAGANILETARVWTLDGAGTLHARMTEKLHGALRTRLEGKDWVNPKIVAPSNRTAWESHVDRLASLSPWRAFKMRNRRQELVMNLGSVRDWPAPCPVPR